MSTHGKKSGTSDEGRDPAITDLRKSVQRLRVLTASLFALTIVLNLTPAAAEIKAKITGEDVVDESLTGADIDDRSLTGVDVAGGSINGFNIELDTLVGGHVEDNTLQGLDVQDDTLTGADVQNGSLTGADIDFNYIFVEANGEFTQITGNDVVSVERVAEGSYTIRFDHNMQSCAGFVTFLAVSNARVYGISGLDLNGFAVRTFDLNANLQDSAFRLTVWC